MEDLQKLMQVKLDAASVLVLQRATELCDNETFNLHYLNENPDVCLCVWGNLSKNPRSDFCFTKFIISDIPAGTQCWFDIDFLLNISWMLINPFSRITQCLFNIVISGLKYQGWFNSDSKLANQCGMPNVYSILNQYNKSHLRADVFSKEMIM